MGSGSSRYETSELALEWWLSALESERKKQEGAQGGCGTEESDSFPSLMELVGKGIRAELELKLCEGKEAYLHSDGEPLGKLRRIYEQACDDAGPGCVGLRFPTHTQMLVDRTRVYLVLETSAFEITPGTRGGRKGRRRRREGKSEPSRGAGGRTEGIATGSV